MIKQFLKLFRNNKVLIENFSSLTLLQGLNMVLPLVTLPYLIKTVGLSLYGVLVFSVSIIFYFQSVIDFSFNVSATRDVSFHRGSLNSLNYIYSRVLSTKLFLLIISSILFLVLLFWVPQLASNKLVFLLTFPILIGHALFPEWFFQGIEKMRYITIINAVIKIFFTMCIFLFIKEQKDYYLYPLFNSLGYILAGLYAQYFICTKYNLHFVFIGWKKIFNVLKQNINLFLNQFFPNLYNNITIVLLAFFSSDAAVGVYGASKSIIEVGNTIIQIISRVFFPHLNKKHDSFHKFKKIILGTSVLFFISIVALSPYIISFFYLENDYTVFILFILAMGIPFLAMYVCFGLNFFIVKRMDKLVMQNTIVVSLIGFVLAFPLVIYYSVIGAAINLTISRMLLGASLWWKYKKYVEHENRNTSSSGKF